MDIIIVLTLLLIFAIMINAVTRLPLRRERYSYERRISRLRDALNYKGRRV